MALGGKHSSVVGMVLRPGVGLVGGHVTARSFDVCSRPHQPPGDRRAGLSCSCPARSARRADGGVEAWV